MLTLIEQLRENPQSFNLFQAISILERAEFDLKPVATSLGVDEAVRLMAQVDLAFSPSDISQLQPSTRPGPPMTLTSSVLSLAGPTGPLPTPFVELFLENRRPSDRPGLDFLDIFNQRLLGLLYRNRRKHHLALSPFDLDSAAIVNSLEILSGLGRLEDAKAPGGETGWLRHASLQGAAPRSIASMLSLIRDRFNISFSAHHFIGGWQPTEPNEQAILVSQRNPENLIQSNPNPKGSKLGLGATLGSKAWNQGAGLRISTPPLTNQEFTSFLPGQRNNLLLQWLVDWHLQSDLQVTLEIDLNCAPTSLLGQGYPVESRLGLSAWLCNSAPISELKSDGYSLNHQKPRFRLNTHDSNSLKDIKSQKEKEVF